MNSQDNIRAQLAEHQAVMAQLDGLVPLIEDMRRYGRRWLPVEGAEPVSVAL